MTEIKDRKTLRQGDRFDYGSIDLDYLRALPLLPEWLRKNPHSRTEIKWEPVGHNNEPPGHPKVLRYKPENWRSNITPIYVIADPLNWTDTTVEYTKENKFLPRGDYNHATGKWNGKVGEKELFNKYYVLSPTDYKRLWKAPLPWTHPRMQAWECDVYYHFGGQYRKDDGSTFENWYISKVYEPRIDPRWKDEVIAEEWAKYHLAKAKEDQERAELKAQYVKPEKNRAYLHIKRWFKDYEPNLALIEDPKNGPGWDLIEPYRWFYLYATLEDMYSDPIWRSLHHADKWLKDVDS
jgi:hypothetical protein